MNLGNLKTFSRLSIPSSKKNRISDPNLTLVINEVVKDMNVRMRILREESKFSTIASQYKYDLSNASETVTRFAKIDKSGLYWNQNTVDNVNWQRLYPRSIKRLDQDFQHWRDLAPGIPQYYFKRGRYLNLYPTPTDDLVNGLWLYFIQVPIPMSSNSDFPFGNTVEIPEYQILTDVIIKGVEWWLLPMTGGKEKQPATFQEYLALIEIKKSMLDSKDDLDKARNTKINLRKIC